MPAYFSIILEFNHDELDFNTMDKLKVYLENAGLEFVSAYNTDKELTIDDIRDHNQKLLEADFDPDTDDSETDRYYQAVYKYKDFPEIRGILLNNSPVEGEYSYMLIIPESEVGEYNEKGFVFRKDRVKLLKELVEKIWIFPEIRTIQTSLEKTEGITSDYDIREGKLPETNPFAVISERHFNHIDKTHYESKVIEYGGVIITSRKRSF